MSQFAWVKHRKRPLRHVTADRIQDSVAIAHNLSEIPGVAVPLERADQGSSAIRYDLFRRVAALIEPVASETIGLILLTAMLVGFSPVLPVAVPAIWRGCRIRMA